MPESAAARAHGRHRVITRIIYSPPSPFTLLRVPVREECCEIARVCFACARVLSLPLLLRLSSRLLSSEASQAERRADTSMADHHHSKITPRPTRSL